MLRKNLKKLVLMIMVFSITVSVFSVSHAGNLAASSARMMYLSQRKSDIEFKLQLINQRRMALAEQSARLAISYSNSLAGNSVETSVPGVLPSNQLTNELTLQPLLPLQEQTYPTNYDQLLVQIQIFDKQLELRANDLEIQQKELESEITSVQRMIDKSIERSFKYMQ